LVGPKGISKKHKSLERMTAVSNTRVPEDSLDGVRIPFLASLVIYIVTTKEVHRCQGSPLGLFLDF
jgi:hypothetical protein